MTYKARKRWALLILVLGLPAYIVACVTLVNWLYPDPAARPSLWAELAIYVGMGVLWAMPLRRIFSGIGQADPDDPN